MASRTAYSTWTPQKPTLLDGHYLRNRSTLDIGVLGYTVIVQHKEHSPEILSIPPGKPCIQVYGELDLCLIHTLSNADYCLQKCSLFILNYAVRLEDFKSMNMNVVFSDVTTCNLEQKLQF